MTIRYAKVPVEFHHLGLGGTPHPNGWGPPRQSISACLKCRCESDSEVTGQGPTEDEAFAALLLHLGYEEAKS